MCMCPVYMYIIHDIVHTCTYMYHSSMLLCVHVRWLAIISTGRHGLDGKKCIHLKVVDHTYQLGDRQPNHLQQTHTHTQEHTSNTVKCKCIIGL